MLPWWWSLPPTPPPTTNTNCNSLSLSPASLESLQMVPTFAHVTLGIVFQDHLLASSAFSTIWHQTIWQQMIWDPRLQQFGIQPQIQESEVCLLYILFSHHYNEFMISESQMVLGNMNICIGESLESIPLVWGHPIWQSVRCDKALQ